MEDKKNTINIKKNKMMAENVMPTKKNIFQAIEEEKQELQKKRREKKLDKDKERVIT